MRYLLALGLVLQACGSPVTSKAPFPDPCGPLPPSGAGVFRPQDFDLTGRFRLTLVNTTGFEEPRRAHGTLQLEPSDTLHRYYTQRLVDSGGVPGLQWVRVPAHAESPWRGKTDLDLKAVAGTADYDSTWYTVEYRHGSLQIGMRSGMLDGGGTVLKPTHASATEMYGRWEAYQGLASHVDRRGNPITDDGYFCATRTQ